MFRVAPIIVTSVIAATSCGFVSTGVEPQDGDRLLREVNALRQPGISRPLSELVPGQWDTVHVFEETVSRDEVEQATGVQFDMDENYSGRGELLVFMDGPDVYRAIELGASRLREGTYSDKVVLRGGPIPNGARLYMVDPV